MRDTNTTLWDVREMVRTFVEKRGWVKAHSPKNLSMSIAIEAAELMEIFQWQDTGESLSMRKLPQPLSEQESAEFTHIKEELADVLIYCMSMANRLNIDIASAIEDKMRKNGQKYPEPSQP